MTVQSFAITLHKIAFVIGQYKHRQKYKNSIFFAQKLL